MHSTVGFASSPPHRFTCTSTCSFAAQLFTPWLHTTSPLHLHMQLCCTTLHRRCIRCIRCISPFHSFFYTPGSSFSFANLRCIRCISLIFSVLKKMSEMHMVWSTEIILLLKIYRGSVFLETSKIFLTAIIISEQSVLGFWWYVILCELTILPITIKVMWIYFPRPMFIH